MRKTYSLLNSCWHPHKIYSMSHWVLQLNFLLGAPKPYIRKQSKNQPSPWKRKSTCKVLKLLSNQGGIATYTAEGTRHGFLLCPSLQKRRSIPHTSTETLLEWLWTFLFHQYPFQNLKARTAYPTLREEIGVSWVYGAATISLRKRLGWSRIRKKPHITRLIDHQGCHFRFCDGSPTSSFYCSYICCIYTNK